MVYYLIFFSLLSISLLKLDKELKEKHNFLLFVLLYMIIILGIRYGVGNDYFSYEGIFYRINNLSSFGIFTYDLSESTPVETGYAGIVYITKIFSNSYLFFVFIWAILSIILKYYTFKKLSPFLALSFLIYFADEWFWKDHAGARVGMASTFILLSVLFAHKRSFLKFLIVIFGATLFHTSAIIGLGIYFLKYFNSRFLMTTLFLISIIIGIKGGMGLATVDFIGSMFGIEDTSRLLKYTDGKYVGEGIFFRGTVLMHITISIFLIYLYKPLVRKWSYNYLLIPMYIYGSVLMFIFIDYGIISSRIREMLCIPAEVIILPSFILLFRGYQRLIPYFLVIGYCILLFSLMMKDRVPYQTILQFIY